MIVRRIFAICFVVLILFNIIGCSGPHGVLRYEAEGERIVFPQKPDKPRYEYVGQLTGQDNIFAPKDESFFIKALKWVVGLYSSKKKPEVLQRPQTGVVDEERGRIYVTDVSLQAVFVFDKPEGRLLIWDRATKGGSGFLSPIGIALGDKGQVLVADSELGVVVRLDADGEPLGSFGAGILERPTGLARDAKTGKIYVSDTHAHNIKVFNDVGNLLTTIGKRGIHDGEFNFPTFLSFHDDKLYVTDTMNFRIQVLTPDGKFLLKFGQLGLNVGDFPRPKGVTVDSEGNIYVVESYYDYLLIYNSVGDFLLPIGGTGHDIGQFYLPAGVWSDSQDRIYVADMFNGRIMIFQYLSKSYLEKQKNQVVKTKAAGSPVESSNVK